METDSWNKNHNRSRFTKTQPLEKRKGKKVEHKTSHHIGREVGCIMPTTRQHWTATLWIVLIQGSAQAFGVSPCMDQCRFQRQPRVRKKGLNSFGDGVDLTRLYLQKVSQFWLLKKYFKTSVSNCITNTFQGGGISSDSPQFPLAGGCRGGTTFLSFCRPGRESFLLLFLHGSFSRVTMKDGTFESITSTHEVVFAAEQLARARD